MCLRCSWLPLLLLLDEWVGWCGLMVLHVSISQGANSQQQLYGIQHQQPQQPQQQQQQQQQKEDGVNMSLPPRPIKRARVDNTTQSTASIAIPLAPSRMTTSKVASLVGIRSTSCSKNNISQSGANSRHSSSSSSSSSSSCSSATAALPMAHPLVGMQQLRQQNRPQEAMPQHMVTQQQHKYSGQYTKRATPVAGSAAAAATTTTTSINSRNRAVMPSSATATSVPIQQGQSESPQQQHQQSKGSGHQSAPISQRLKYGRITNSGSGNGSGDGNEKGIISLPSNVNACKGMMHNLAAGGDEQLSKWVVVACGYRQVPLLLRVVAVLWPHVHLYLYLSMECHHLCLAPIIAIATATATVA
jgi:hypothetical protein